MCGVGGCFVIIIIFFFSDANPALVVSKPLVPSVFPGYKLAVYKTTIQTSQMFQHIGSRLRVHTSSRFGLG